MHTVQCAPYRWILERQVQEFVCVRGRGGAVRTKNPRLGTVRKMCDHCPVRGHFSLLCLQSVRCVTNVFGFEMHFSNERRDMLEKFPY
jgi:hypothetical protein